jgi:hypothetical protein
MSQFIVDPEIQSLLPPLTADEEAGLEAKLKAEGCREPLSVGAYTGLDKPILIDGHHRRRICSKLGIDYKVADAMSFNSRAELIQWVIDNQLSRRNLTDERRSYYRGREYLNTKQAHGGQISDSASDNGKGMSQNETSLRTDVAIAEKHGVSRATIARDAEFAKAVDEIKKTDPKKAEAILNGDTKLTKSAVIKQTRPVPEKKPRAAKSGREKFDWKKLDKSFGEFSRSIEDIAKAYDDKNCLEHRNLHKSLDGVYKLVLAWRKRLLKLETESNPLHA